MTDSGILSQSKEQKQKLFASSSLFFFIQISKQIDLVGIYLPHIKKITTPKQVVESLNILCNLQENVSKRSNFRLL